MFFISVYNLFLLKEMGVEINENSKVAKLDQEKPAIFHVRCKISKCPCICDI